MTSYLCIIFIISNILSFSKLILPKTPRSEALLGISKKKTKSFTG